jgi:gluconate 5-dehydrogenase
MGVVDRFRLDGKRLFITGGSRGLGREMALANADAGADVPLTGCDEQSLKQTAADIRMLERNAWAIQADMGEAQTCEVTSALALAEHGPFDILIKNVDGRREPTLLREMSVESWRRLVDLNLTYLHQGDRRCHGRPRHGWSGDQYCIDQCVHCRSEHWRSAL